MELHSVPTAGKLEIGIKGKLKEGRGRRRPVARHRPGAQIVQWHCRKKVEYTRNSKICLACEVIAFVENSSGRQPAANGWIRIVVTLRRC